MTKVYILNIIPEDFTTVFSSEEKAFAYLVGYCRSNWDDIINDGDREIPDDDTTLIKEYFDQIDEFAIDHDSSTNPWDIHALEGDDMSVGSYTIKSYDLDGSDQHKTDIWFIRQRQKEDA